METQSTVFNFSANIFRLSLNGSATCLDGYGQRELWSVQNLERVYALIDGPLHEHRDNAADEGRNAFKMHAFNIDLTVERLLILIERQLDISLRPTPEPHAVTQKIVAAVESQWNENLPVSELDARVNAAPFSRKSNLIGTARLSLAGICHLSGSKLKRVGRRAEIVEDCAEQRIKELPVKRDDNRARRVAAPVRGADYRTGQRLRFRRPDKEVEHEQPAHDQPGQQNNKISHYNLPLRQRAVGAGDAADGWFMLFNIAPAMAVAAVTTVFTCWRTCSAVTLSIPRGTSKSDGSAFV